MQCVFAAGAAVFGEVQFLGSFGLIPLGDVVEVATNGAFQA